jgi:hypothetical protein
VCLDELVAPRAGAWVETKVAIHPQEIVAPRAGAWVETRSSVSTEVAPRAGAWVETREQPIPNISSHPVRVRGLKLVALRVVRRACI